MSYKFEYNAYTHIHGQDVLDGNGTVELNHWPNKGEAIEVEGGVYVIRRVISRPRHPKKVPLLDTARSVADMVRQEREN